MAMPWKSIEPDIRNILSNSPKSERNELITSQLIQHFADIDPQDEKIMRQNVLFLTPFARKTIEQELMACREKVGITKEKQNNRIFVDVCTVQDPITGNDLVEYDIVAKHFQQADHICLDQLSSWNRNVAMRILMQYVQLNFKATNTACGTQCDQDIFNIIDRLRKKVGIIDLGAKQFSINEENEWTEVDTADGVIINRGGGSSDHKEVEIQVTEHKSNSE
jgi:hypothetical protein